MHVTIIHNDGDDGGGGGGGGGGGVGGVGGGGGGGGGRGAGRGGSLTHGTTSWLDHCVTTAAGRSFTSNVQQNFMPTKYIFFSFSNS